MVEPFGKPASCMMLHGWVIGSRDIWGRKWVRIAGTILCCLTLCLAAYHRSSDGVAHLYAARIVTCLAVLLTAAVVARTFFEGATARQITVALSAEGFGQRRGRAEMKFRPWSSDVRRAIDRGTRPGVYRLRITDGRSLGAAVSAEFEGDDAFAVAILEQIDGWIAGPEPRSSDRLLMERCPACGYVLAGLPDRGRCPECGSEHDPDTIVLFGWGTGSTARPYNMRYVSESGFQIGLAAGLMSLFVAWLVGWNCCFVPAALVMLMQLVAIIRFRALHATGLTAPMQVRLTPDGFAEREGIGPATLLPWFANDRITLNPTGISRCTLKIMRAAPPGNRAAGTQTPQPLLEAELDIDEETRRRLLDRMRDWIKDKPALPGAASPMPIDTVVSAPPAPGDQQAIVPVALHQVIMVIGAFIGFFGGAMLGALLLNLGRKLGLGVTSKWPMIAAAFLLFFGGATGGAAMVPKTIARFLPARCPVCRGITDLESDRGFRYRCRVCGNVHTTFSGRS